MSGFILSTIWDFFLKFQKRQPVPQSEDTCGT